MSTKPMTCAEAGKLRWKGKTKREIKEAMSEIAGKISPKAAKARSLKAMQTRRKKGDKKAS